MPQIVFRIINTLYPPVGPFARGPSTAVPLWWHCTALSGRRGWSARICRCLAVDNCVWTITRRRLRPVQRKRYTKSNQRNQTIQISTNRKPTKTKKSPYPCPGPTTPRTKTMSFTQSSYDLFTLFDGIKIILIIQINSYCFRISNLCDCTCPIAPGLKKIAWTTIGSFLGLQLHVHFSFSPSWRPL